MGTGQSGTVGAAARRTRIPRVVTVLALGTFALGTSEFMIVGLLPALSADLAVTIPQAGYLISAFAVGMIVGAPAMALATLRLPRRTTAVAALLVFIVGNAVAALSGDYPVLLVARLLTAVATATFWVVATVVTVSVVDVADRTRALAVLLAGLTVSNVVGIPLGTLIGQQLGWRASFWAVAILAGAGLVGVLLTLRGNTDGGSPGSVAAEVAVFRQGRLWVALGTVALYQAAVIGMFSYVSPLLTDVAGIGSRWVPLVLLGYGVGSLAGVWVGGRLGDAHPWSTLFGGLAAVAVLLGLLSVTAAQPVVAVVLVVLLGVVSFVVAAPLNARVFGLAGAAPTLASSTNTSAFNVGNSLGPALGGAAISGGLGYTAPSWLGAVLAVGAIALGLVSRGLDARAARREPAPTPAGSPV
jgi:DHA1 family chloramphenicol resistance protein-like MFS transporter